MIYLISIISTILALIWHLSLNRAWLAHLGVTATVTLGLIILVVVFNTSPNISSSRVITFLFYSSISFLISLVIGVIFTATQKRGINKNDIKSFLKFHAKSFKRKSMIIGIAPIVTVFILFLIVLLPLTREPLDGPGDGMAMVAVVFIFSFIGLFISLFCLIIIYILYFRTKAMIRGNTNIIDVVGLTLASILPLVYFVSVIRDPALANINFSSKWIWYKWAYSVITVTIVHIIVIIKSAWTLARYKKSLILSSNYGEPPS